MKSKQIHKFKETEIGKIPEDWKVVELNDICEITSSKRIFFKDYVKEGIPFYRSKEIILKSNNSLISEPLFITRERFEEINDKFGVPKEGDILLTSVGTLGIPYLVGSNEQFYFKDGNLTWFRRIKCDKLFLLYWLKSNYARNQIESRAIGTTQRALTIENIKKMLLVIPSLTEQQTISSILYSFDLKIKQIQQINKTLEKIIHAIFKSWFVDLDGQTEFVDSELGPIPEGWEVKSIGEVVELVNGFSYKGSEKFETPTEYVFITLNNIMKGGGFKTDYYWLESARVKDRHFVKELDLIFANIHFGVGGSNVARLLASVAFVVFPYFYKKDKGVFSLDITKVLTNSDEMKYYLYHVLKIKQEEIASTYQKGTSIRRLQVEGFLKQFKILVPPSSFLQDFKKESYPIWNEICQNEKQISVLEKLRGYLLPKLMSGEIRV